MATRRAPPRPYVTSAYKIDFHVDENKTSLDLLTKFLISAGKVRSTVIEKLKSQESSSAETSTLSNKDKLLITIGLKETLKNNNSNKLKWILLDGDTVNPSAVGQVFGLLATNETNKTKFYVIPKLSSTISKALNLPKVSAIGFGADCIEIEEFISNLHPIDIVLKKKIEESSSTSTSFVPPQLEVPKGKVKGISKPKKAKKLRGAKA